MIACDEVEESLGHEEEVTSDGTDLPLPLMAARRVGRRWNRQVWFSTRAHPVREVGR